MIKQLAGRLVNECQAGHGRLWHWLVSGKAVCGTKPGKRSAGWVPFHGEGDSVTCPRCLKQIANRLCKAGDDCFCLEHEAKRNFKS